MGRLAWAKDLQSEFVVNVNVAGVMSSHSTHLITIRTSAKGKRETGSQSFVPSQRDFMCRARGHDYVFRRSPRAARQSKYVDRDGS